MVRKLSLRQRIENLKATTGREIVSGLKDIATGARAGTSARQINIKDVKDVSPGLVSSFGSGGARRLVSGLTPRQIETNRINAIRIAEAQRQAELRRLELLKKQAQAKAQAESRAVRERRLQRKLQKKSFIIRRQRFTTQQLIKLSLQEDLLKKRPNETTASFQSRLVGRGKGIAFAFPTQAKTIIKGGGFVSQTQLDKFTSRKKNILENIRLAGKSIGDAKTKEGKTRAGKKLQKLRKDLREVNKLLSKVGGTIRLSGGAGKVVKKKTIEAIKRILKRATKKIPRKLDFPVPIFTAGAGTKSLRLKQVTKGVFRGLENRGFSKRRIASFTRLSDKQIDKLPKLSEKEKENLKKIARLQQEVIIGGLEEIEEKPEKIIVTTFLSALAPGSIKAIGGSKRAVKILKRIPPNVKAKGAKAISRFLTTTYLASAGIRIIKEPTPEKRAQRFGRILVGEVIPFEIGTRIGVRGLLKAELQKEIDQSVRGMSRVRQQAFRDYMKQAEVFGKFEPKARNIKLTNIDSIKNTKAQSQIRKFLVKSEGKVVVGGSVAQTSQVNVGRKLGDIDLYVDKGGGSISSQAKKLANQLKKLGIKRVSSIKGQVTIEGKKAVEFHDIDRLITNIEQVTPIWSRSRSYIIKTPEGIRIQRIGLQARRKVIASFADPKRLKTGKYKKDLIDFKRISDQIFKNAIKKSKRSFFFKKKKLRRIGKIFKRKIPRAKKVKIPKSLKKPIKIKKIKKFKIKKRKRIKKVKKIKKPKLKKRRIKTRRKKIKKKFKPSQKRIRKRIKFKPSQKPPKRRRKFRPSQPPTKRRKIKRIIRKGKRKGGPSQPPSKPPKKKPIPKIVPGGKRRFKVRKKKLIPIIFKGKKRRIKLRKRKQKYDVFARPTKLRKKGRRLIKVNKNVKKKKKL